MRRCSESIGKIDDLAFRAACIDILPMENFNCCNQMVRGLAAWDDAQLTDHAYNLSMCDKCGIIYKEDVWSDKGMRAIFLDGSMATSSAEWEESGILKGLDGRLKSIVLDYLKLAEVKFAKRDDRVIHMVFFVIRHVLSKLFEQPERDRLLKLFDLDELASRSEELHVSGKIDEHAKDRYFYIDAEIELTMQMCDKYVSDLLEKAAT